MRQKRITPPLPMSPTKKVPIIISVVCNEYKIAVKDLVDPNLTKQKSVFSEPKYVAIYLVRNNTNYTMLRIGQMFGFSQAGSFTHVFRWIAEQCFTDPVFKKRLEKLEAILPTVYKQTKIV
jgi:chromosomal replication initiation ATPase DnaA